MISRRSFCKSAVCSTALTIFMPRPVWSTSTQTLTLINGATQQEITGQNTPNFNTKANALLVCAQTKKVGKLDPKLITLLFAMAAQLKIQKFEIISAYRDLELTVPKRQAVGDHLQHFHGQAVDIRVEGDMDTWVKAAQTVGFKGIGIMKSSNTLHLDLGSTMKLW